MINCLSSTVRLFIGLCTLGVCMARCGDSGTPKIVVNQHDHIMLIGGNLCSRMINFGHFETELQLNFPDHQLLVRNMCDGGDTPGFRPHSGRPKPWAFEGAEVFQTELARDSRSVGHLEFPDEWLTRLKTDVILAFFGYSESFTGDDGIELFKDELQAFIEHTLAQRYNQESTPQLILVSPIAFEDLSAIMDLPDGQKENSNLKKYTDVIRQVAAQNSIPFVDLFYPSLNWYNLSGDPLTIDGFQLNDKGNKMLGSYLAKQVFGKSNQQSEYRDLVHEAVMEKNWFWHNDFKIPNGVHVFGRRYDPFGPDNYPYELKKIREMTAIRDTAIWKALHGEAMDLIKADATTSKLPPVQSNYEPSDKNGNPQYLYGEDALAKLKVPPGYKIELFASEQEFDDLANPVQMSFDNKGRLWVATMPSYPHYKPGDSKPDDKLIILEDTDGDGKADKQTTFADKLHLPIGFEIAREGVYLSQGTNLVLLVDEDGDDQADRKEILLSGFDDHDTHHAISAFCADPSGAIYMGEGVFLHTNVETPYGTVRATNGGFYRYAPQRHHLERTAQISIPNPWGIAFDEWGQPFFAETSGPDVRWMTPGSIKPLYGVGSPKSYNLIEDAHRVRPTSGLEYMHSSHFPDELQGGLMINNTIGFLGTKIHTMVDDGTGYDSQHQLDLVVGSDPNFRPVDMEIAPDGSLYLVDWHNVLIGHMQHNARDPYRDHVHGRVYRITYPSRPLIEPAKIVDASIEELMDNLKLNEYRTRYRTRRELRGRDKNEVLSALQIWIRELDQKDARYEHHLLEALWVSWGHNQVDQELLNRLLNANDFRARTAAVKVLRYVGHQVNNQIDLLAQAIEDENSRVRLEAIVTSSWQPAGDALDLLSKAISDTSDIWIKDTYQSAVNFVQGRTSKETGAELVTALTGVARNIYVKGHEIYNRDGFCVTCHQADGKGLEASGFPPLAGTKWVNGDVDRLIKITLKGLLGPITVNGKDYPGQVPMTPYEGMLNDTEIAAVLTYVRNSFTNEAGVVYPEQVKKVREEVKDFKGFYNPTELLQVHPH